MSFPCYNTHKKKKERRKLTVQSQASFLLDDCWLRLWFFPAITKKKQLWRSSSCFQYSKHCWWCFERYLIEAVCLYIKALFFSNSLILKKIFAHSLFKTSLSKMKRKKKKLYNNREVNLSKCSQKLRVHCRNKRKISLNADTVIGTFLTVFRAKIFWGCVVLLILKLTNTAYLSFFF